ncbi:MAG TPA: MMPL family transporter, partial [bacterium]
MRLIRALIDWQTRRPLRVLAVALGTAALAAHGASHLELKTDFDELLPQGKRSVIVARRVGERLPSGSTLNVVVRGGDREALKRFVDALAAELRALGPELAGTVDEGPRELDAFLKRNRYLYAPLADVQDFHDRILDRYEYEVGKRAGMDLELGDTAPPRPVTREWIEETRRRYEQAEAERRPGGSDGYYLEAGGTFIVLVLRTPVMSVDLGRQRALLERVRGAVERVGPERFGGGLRVDYAGDLITGAEEFSRIKGDLTHVGAAGVAMVLGVVFLFFLRVRALVVMALAVGVGVAWTFGFTAWAIGSLNSATGFLFSIVVGNGINFGIIYQARYLEARRSQDVAASLRVAHAETWAPTLAAAAAAMTSYGSLAVTDFRGFKHFGVIGGAGMILCWIATYLFLPALLAATERIAPLRRDGRLVAALRGGYGRPFAWAAARLPRAVTIAGVGTGLVAIVLTAHYVLNDPMEYDMSVVRSDPPESGRSVARELTGRVENLTGARSQDRIAVATDRLDQVLPLKAALEARRDAAPAARKPFERVITIFDVLPADQEQKVALLLEARDRVLRLRGHRAIPDADWAAIEPELPPPDLRPLAIADLPEQVARPFTEKDGTRGRLVYVTPTPGRSLWDAHYLIDWAAAIRTTRLADGSVIEGSGRSVIFADVIESVVSDAPKALAASVAGTLLVIAVAFRRRRAALLVLGSLGLGIAWMGAVLALYKAQFDPAGWPYLRLHGMKMNFLNFVAVPISIGIGVDYAVNIVQRYRLLGPGRLREVVVETGGAVILCSLTTTLGYFALVLSINRAIASFGIAAAAGEIGCIVAAVLVLPALLQWRADRA